jgi:hypothetical protein
MRKNNLKNFRIIEILILNLKNFKFFMKSLNSHTEKSFLSTLLWNVVVTFGLFAGGYRSEDLSLRKE